MEFAKLKWLEKKQHKQMYLSSLGWAGENRNIIGFLFCIMLFCLISAPCMATLAITRKETGSWGWAAFQFFGLTVLGYVVTLIVYQLGSMLS